MKKFVAMYANVGKSYMSYPHLLGVYNSKEEAMSKIIDDMEEWSEYMNPDGDCNVTYEEDGVIAHYGDNHCYWNVEEVRVY